MISMIERNELQKTTAERIKTLRELRGISQAALARAAGLSRVTMNRIEQGIQLPDWPTVCNIADALQVQIDQIRKNVEMLS